MSLLDRLERIRAQREAGAAAVVVPSERVVVVESGARPHASVVREPRSWVERARSGSLPIGGARPVVDD